MPCLAKYLNGLDIDAYVCFSAQYYAITPAHKPAGSPSCPRGSPSAFAPQTPVPRCTASLTSVLMYSSPPSQCNLSSIVLKSCHLRNAPLSFWAGRSVLGGSSGRKSPIAEHLKAQLIQYRAKNLRRNYDQGGKYPAIYQASGRFQCFRSRTGWPVNQASSSSRLCGSRRDVCA